MDTTTPRSRRALLAAAFGGVAAVATQAIGSPAMTRAGSGAVNLGAVNVSGDTTTLRNPTDQSVVLRARSEGAGIGVQGISDSRAGVLGRSRAGPGVAGESASGAGVEGRTGSGIGVRGASADGYGVVGNSQTNVAVYGSTDTGYGVFGQSRWGTALYGLGEMDSFALQTDGKVTFLRSAGIATIPAGSRSVTVDPDLAVNADSKILATITEGDPGGTTTVQRISRDTVAGTFAIRLTADAAAAVMVAWFIIS